MESPFPGVDPFVEGSGRWKPFHDRFIVAAQAMILPNLSEEYDCDVEVEIVLRERSAEERLVGRADWAFRGGPAGDSGAGGTAVATVPKRNAFPVAAVQEEHLLSLRLTDRNHDRVVCVVELLSPSNKTGGDRDQYLTKRQNVERSDAHFVEIDLLRRGRRMPLREPVEEPYLVLVSRAEERPELDLWPFGLRDPLPTVPIPLLGDDPPVMLDLQEAFRRTFAEGQYHRRVYDAPPDPPLSAADAAWAADLLTAAGVPLPAGFPPSPTSPME